jgi:uncharacterized protein YndB with AHSA1/START domain
MEKLHFEVEIHAPVGVVWRTMLDDETYRVWAGAFHEGSYYEGGWATGDAIRFLGDNDDGTRTGMIGFIDVSRPEEFVSIEYTGMVDHDVDDFTGDFAKKFAGSHENYTFVEKDGVTTVTVELDTIDEFREMFDEMWPRALESLREIAEQAAR